MCETCGCGEPDNKPEQTQDPIGRDLLSANDKAAQHNREHLRRIGAFMVHLTSSPGSGKTTLLEKTVEALKGKLSIGVIEGDVATENDAERMRAMGVPSEAIVTDGACHLDAKQVHHALHHLAEKGNLDLIFVENVGNLVCPADFDLGEDYRVVLVSTAEGDDKPEKYPPIFRRADALVISKTDLLPHVDFCIDKVKKHAQTIAPRIRTFEISAKGGDGLDEWIAWLSNIVPAGK
ncbi:MAG TPA: hydrogenase accessory protein HypB [candidate division Zixibacteria bacterium]|nr:hydrogenase accessory protein HypB [candidate division Zixibacteria bacterium]